MKVRFATWCSRVFGIGNLPGSPGTFGSLPGLLVGYLLQRYLASPLWIALALLGLIAFSYWCIDVYEKALGVHDDQRIVIDEVCGQAIAVAFLAPSLLYYAGGFALFRLLDIAKPPPIGTIDAKVPGAAGTLFDDVLAGALAAAIMQGILLFLGNR
jgi:phosphatidylglycerophosphatase A